MDLSNAVIDTPKTKRSTTHLSLVVDNATKTPKARQQLEANAIVDAWLADPARPVVAGYYTGFGKTPTALCALKQAATKSSEPMLVAWIAHGLKKLRDQAYEEACEWLPDWAIRRRGPNPDFRPSSNGCQHVLEVFLVQNLDNDNIPPFNYIVVDEAHERVLGDGDVDTMVGKLIKKLDSSRQLFLTATPFEFNGKIEYQVRHVCLGEGYLDPDAQVSPLIWEVAFSNLDQGLDQFLNDDGNVKEGVELPKKFQKAALLEVLRKLAYRIAMDRRKTKDFVDPSFITKLREATLGRLKQFFTKRSGKFHKSLFVAYSIKQAHWIKQQLTELGWRVVVSESEGDPEGHIIDAFEADDCPYDALVVVDRCRLGWNCPKIVYAVDFSFSKSISIIIQTLGRLTRPFQARKNDPKDCGVHKVYMKVTSADFVRQNEAYCNIAANVVMNPDLYRSYKNNTLSGDETVCTAKICAECELPISKCECVCDQCGNVYPKCDCPKKVTQRPPTERPTRLDLNAMAMNEGLAQRFVAFRANGHDSLGVYSATTLDKELMRVGELRTVLSRAENIELLKSLYATEYATMNEQQRSQKNHLTQKFREAYKNGQLSQEEIETLESIPGWSWDARQYDPIALMKACDRWKDDHGYMPSTRSLDPEEVRLAGFWRTAATSKNAKVRAWSAEHKANGVLSYRQFKVQQNKNAIEQHTRQFGKPTCLRPNKLKVATPEKIEGHRLARKLAYLRRDDPQWYKEYHERWGFKYKPFEDGE